ncbi:hypothetical protein FOMPIDRAFT_12395, partial [Fomitopsis schrenkii]
IKTKVVIPGRAILVTTKWHSGKQLTILNVYAPNAATTNEAFWEELEQKFTNGRLRRPDVVTGDFNLVEEAIDRIPTKESVGPPLRSLKSFLSSVKVYDGWRLTNNVAKEYTYPQRGGQHRSRIDRIYVSEDLLQRSMRWDIEVTGVPTDHSMVTAQLTAAKSPYIGRGRWAMPIHLLLDQNFRKQVSTLGEKELRAAQECAEDGTRSDERNPQRILHCFKQEVKALAQKRLKEKIPKLKAEITRLEKEKNTIQNGQNFAEDREAQEAASTLQE